MSLSTKETIKWERRIHEETHALARRERERERIGRLYLRRADIVSVLRWHFIAFDTRWRLQTMVN